MFYRFNLIEEKLLVLDEEGAEFADLAAARAHAIRAAREIIASDVSAGILNFDPSIDIIDADGSKVMTVRFAEAVTPSLKLH